MFGRTIKCTIANDNGRATEFIRRKNYPDKSHCYECGVRLGTKEFYNDILGHVRDSVHYL